MQVLLLEFNSKSELSTPLVFKFSDNVRLSIKGIRVRYAELMALPNTFKGAVDMN